MSIDERVHRAVGEDRPFQQRFWALQRMGWLAMGLFALLAVLGLTGAGGIFASRTVAIGPDRVTLPRVLRWDADEDVRIALAARPGEMVDIGLGGAFARQIEIRTIMPEPAESYARGGYVHYRFVARGHSDAVVLRIRPMRPALALDTRIRIDGSERRLALPVLP